VRAASFNTEEIQYDQHEEWYREALQNEEICILIGLDTSDEKIGMVRFQKKNDRVTISVAISPTIQGKGYGTAIIREGCSEYLKERIVVDEIVAEIKESNETSKKAFSKAGFVETQSSNNMVTMKKFRSLDNYRVGVKIFTSNKESFGRLKEFYEKDIIDYVELYIVPGIVDKKSLYILKGIPIIFHAPNINHGFNLRDKNTTFKKSIQTLEEISKYLGEKSIIFHPGLEAGENDIENITNTLIELGMKFDIILENMPKKPVHGDREIIGSSYDEFVEIIRKTEVRFCIDIGHTIYSANHYGVDALEYLQKFIDQGPFMFHIGDGDFSGSSDVHKHLGEGDFPLFDIIAKLPKFSMVTLETPKTDFKLLSEDLENLQRLKDILRKVHHD